MCNANDKIFNNIFKYRFSIKKKNIRFTYKYKYILTYRKGSCHTCWCSGKTLSRSNDSLKIHNNPLLPLLTLSDLKRDGKNHETEKKFKILGL